MTPRQPPAGGWPPLDAERLWARVQHLSGLTDPGIPWTRRAFSTQFVAARAWLREEFAAAGMAVHQDAGGNLIGRLAARAGADGNRPIVTGSHCDTVMMGGRFDGIIGVLAGIEVARALHERGVELAHPFEVVDFLSEEPSDYGVSCVGSRAWSGALSAPMLAARNADGETLAVGMRRIGCAPERLTQALRGPGSTAAFVELHIEQGPLLERRGLPIGVVTDIVGIRRVGIHVAGRADHAGTTPMDVRRDALVGAARIIDGANRAAAARSGKPHYVVATVGHLTLTPNAANAVPGTVDLTLEVRSEDRAILEVFPEQLLAELEPGLRGLGLTVHMETISRSNPTACAELVMGAVERAAAGLGLDCMRLPSGAGHDAAYVAPTGPVGMIFIPCLNGRSHCPEEWIDPAQLLDGARVLYRTVLELDRALSVPPTPFGHP